MSDRHHDRQAMSCTFWDKSSALDCTARGNSPTALRTDWSIPSGNIIFRWYSTLPTAIPKDSRVSSCLHRASIVSKTALLLFQLMHTVIKS